jgi:surface polysaccharide O-acyltransferase-like enzyme
MRRNNDFLDLLKFVLSLIVVAIHANPLGNDLGYLRFPLVRVAVPLFFMISGYFFLGKLMQIQEVKKKRIAIMRFVKRNLQLYLSWFIVLFPLIVFNRGYFSHGIVAGIVTIIKDFFFGSTFIASWYLMALVIGVLIVCMLCKFFGNTGIFVVGLSAYILCCLACSYRNLFSDGLFPAVIWQWYPDDIFNSFPVSIIWLGLGKWIAEHEVIVDRIPRKFIYGTGILSLAALLAEHCMIQAFGWAFSNDCYFLLLPVCTVLFIVALNVKIHFSQAVVLRRCSTVIFCLHGALLVVFGFLIRRLGIDTWLLPGAIIQYVLVVLGCLVASALLIRLRRVKCFSFLNLFV